MCYGKENMACSRGPSSLADRKNRSNCFASHVGNARAHLLGPLLRQSEYVLVTRWTKWLSPALSLQL